MMLCLLAASMIVLGVAATDDSAPANTLTPEEEAAGWTLLFDGDDLDAWRGYRMDEIPAGWSVVDGTIEFQPPRGDGGQRADLITKELYDDFELALEWRISPGGNSGVMFRVTEDHERSYHTGPEMQILDDDEHRDGANPATSTGANYALHAPAEDVVRPVGEYNAVRMVVRGPHVEHWLNGVKIVEYELWNDEWKEKVAASKFEQWPRYGMNRSGHVVLQDHGNRVRFRNLKIRRLDDASSSSGGAAHR